MDRRVQNQTGREVRGGPSSAHAECNPVGRRPCNEIEAAQGRVHRHRRRLQLGRGRTCRGRRARRVNAVLLSAMTSSRRHWTLPRSTNPPPPSPLMTTRRQRAANILGSSGALHGIFTKVGACERPSSRANVKSDCMWLSLPILHTTESAGRNEALAKSRAPSIGSALGVRRGFGSFLPMFEGSGDEPRDLGRRSPCGGQAPRVVCQARLLR